jgi:hypothetical protein
VRSLIWLKCAQPIMAEAGYATGGARELAALLRASIPRERRATALPAVVGA